MNEVQQRKLFTEEDEKFYSELWDILGPNANVTGEERKIAYTQNENRLVELNEYCNVPSNIYSLYLPFIKFDTLIVNGVLTPEFTITHNKIIMNLFNLGTPLGVQMVTHISRSFTWYDSCGFVNESVKSLYLMYNVFIRNKGEYTTLQNSLPDTMKIFTHLFAEEIIDMSETKYLVGYPYVLNAIANGIKLEPEYSDMVLKCVGIAIENELNFVTDVSKVFIK